MATCLQLSMHIGTLVAACGTIQLMLLKNAWGIHFPSRCKFMPDVHQNHPVNEGFSALQVLLIKHVLAAPMYVEQGTLPYMVHK